MLITASCVALISLTLTVVVEAILDTLNVVLASLAAYISLPSNLAITVYVPFAKLDTVNVPLVLTMFTLYVFPLTITLTTPELTFGRVNLIVAS